MAISINKKVLPLLNDESDAIYTIYNHFENGIFNFTHSFYANFREQKKISFETKQFNFTIHKYIIDAVNEILLKEKSYYKLVIEEWYILSVQMSDFFISLIKTIGKMKITRHPMTKYMIYRKYICVMLMCRNHNQQFLDLPNELLLLIYDYMID